MATTVPGDEAVHVVDTHLLSAPNLMSGYVVDADRPAVIDPGAATATERVLSALSELGIDPEDVEYLVPTHVHLDHAGAVGALARKCENAAILCHEKGVRYIADEARLDRLVASARSAIGPVADAYGDPDPVPRDRCDAVAGGETVDLGDRTLELIDAPGHAPHQLCPYDADRGTLFAADAVGMYLDETLLPATPAPDFDLAASLATLDRLRARDPERLCFGHFGVRTDAVVLLEEYSNVLDRWVAAVREARARHGDDVTAVANELRSEWPSPILERSVQGVLRAVGSS